MKKRCLLTVLLLFGVSCTDTGTAPDEGLQTRTSASVDQKIDVIVVLKGHINGKGHGASNKARALSTANSMGLVTSHSYGSALTGFAASIPEGRIAALEHDPRVAFVGSDELLSMTGERFPQTLPNGINRIEGDQSSTHSGDGSGTVNVGIAILDSGIDGTHADLNVQGGINCSPGSGDSYADDNGHGTHVAGTAAARDNDRGVVGVAPGAPLFAVKAFDKNGHGNISAVICGIDWVTANSAALGIKVANMSLGQGVKKAQSADDGNCGRSNNDALHVAICNGVASGVTFVVSAGNDAADISSQIPAGYGEVLTVTAMADLDGQPGQLATQICPSGLGATDDSVASFSNFATGTADRSHTIAAPGVCVLSTGWLSKKVARNNPEILAPYYYMTGTSMAAPHVTGTVALCISSGSCTGTPAQIIQTVRAGAAARPASAGFIGDPNHPQTVDGQVRYYGYLVYAGGY